MERNLLRRLCQGAGVSALSGDDVRRLREHRWTHPDHHIVFEAWLRLANLPAASLRARLPGEATRMGFPDMDWNTYFEAKDDRAQSNAGAGYPLLPPPEQPLSELIAELTAESARRQ